MIRFCFIVCLILHWDMNPNARTWGILCSNNSQLCPSPLICPSPQTCPNHSICKNPPICPVKLSCDPVMLTCYPLMLTCGQVMLTCDPVLKHCGLKFENRQIPTTIVVPLTLGMCPFWTFLTLGIEIYLSNRTNPHLMESWLSFQQQRERKWSYFEHRH